MLSSPRSYLLVAFVLAAGGAVLLATSPTHAQGNGNGNGNGGGPPTWDTRVVNGAANPVPVSGSIAVTGTATVQGSVQATQSGPWSVGVSGPVQSAQSGQWTVGIDPTRNLVAVGSSPSFDYDGGFSVINEGATLEFGPFDLSDVKTLRIMTRAVNGDVRFELVVPSGFGGMRLDQIDLAGESGNRYESRSYDAPPPSVSIRVTETGGPGGANYHFMLIGR